MGVNVNLELTDRCNIRCRMCSQSMREEAHGQPMRHMAWETWRAALAGLRSMGEEVHLCPHWLGEPTIHPQFDRFVEYAFFVNDDNRLFRSFKLHTNGVVFGEERARLLIRLANQPGQHPDTFNFIHFSIDAHSAEAYRLVKGADKRDQVYRNVERFLQIRAEMGMERPFVTLAYVVQPGNAEEAGAFLAHWRAALSALGRPLRATVDWPDQAADTVYLRPLNCGEQAEADRLHAEVCRALGLTTAAGDRLRGAESF
jgi:molybdenum cofactor biosynthesis enzyme MoaA